MTTVEVFLAQGNGRAIVDAWQDSEFTILERLEIVRRCSWDIAAAIYQSPHLSACMRIYLRKKYNLPEPFMTYGFAYSDLEDIQTLSFNYRWCGGQKMGRVAIPGESWDPRIDLVSNSYAVLTHNYRFDNRKRVLDQLSELEIVRFRSNGVIMDCDLLYLWDRLSDELLLSLDLTHRMVELLFVRLVRNDRLDLICESSFPGISRVLAQKYIHDRENLNLLSPIMGDLRRLILHRIKLPVIEALDDPDYSAIDWLNEF